MRKTMRLVPMFSIVVGLFFGIYSLMHYTFFVSFQGPADGFLPLILSALLVVVGGMDICKHNQNESGSMSGDNWLIILCVGLVIVLSYVIGMIPCILLFSFLWLKIKEQCTWKQTIISMLVVSVLVVGIFAAWMDISFPEGLIYNLIAG